MSEKNDWRLLYQEEYLMNAELKKQYILSRQKNGTTTIVLFVGINSVRIKMI